MRKLFGLLLCLVALTSSAQLKLGISAGYDMAQFAGSGTNSDFYNMSAIDGFHVGLIGEQSLKKNFFLSEELQFAHKGGIVNRTQMSTSGKSYTMTLNYIQLPILAKYKYALSKTSKLIIGAGLYAAVGLSGKQNGTETAKDVYGTPVVSDFNDKVDFTFNSTNPNDNVIKPLDWGYVFNLGIEWKKFQFTLNYMNSFGNIHPNSNAKFTNETYGVAVAYLLPW